MSSMYVVFVQNDNNLRNCNFASLSEHILYLFLPVYIDEYFYFILVRQKLNSSRFSSSNTKQNKNESTPENLMASNGNLLYIITYVY